MRIRRHHRAALAIAALGTAIGVTPVQTAAADGAGPEVTLQLPDAVDVNGAAGDVELAVANPPTGDAYLQLATYDASPEALRVTDDAGNALPSSFDSATKRTTFDIGSADTDHNGVPGGPLQTGTFHVHLAARFPVSPFVRLSAVVADGATGEAIPGQRSGWDAVDVRRAAISMSWNSPRYGADRNPSIPIDTGAAQPTVVTLQTDMTALRTPPAVTRTRWIFTAKQLADAGYSARQVAGSVTVRHSWDGTHYTGVGWTTGEDGSLFAELPARTWSGNDKPVSETLQVTAAWGLHAGSLKGTVQTLDGNGVPYAGAEQGLNLQAAWVPFYARGAFYGRDGNGVLWQYQQGENIDYQRYTFPHRVGGGWQAYDLVTKLSTLKANGTGDLVARDRGGVLWYYRGSGDGYTPFASRAKVGGGWQVYSALVGAGDLTGDGRPDLLARDRDGVLWLYRGTGSASAPFAPRARVGGGWNTYTALIGGADLTGDGRPDLLARDHDGVLWLYRGTGDASSPLAPRSKVGGGWNTYTAIVSAGDLTGNGTSDLIARDQAGGLWLYRGTGNPSAPFQPRFAYGTGWNTYTTIL
ncbi:VCBS repeat-containing protein [Streptomyces sp. NPDC023838]|uniref:VCBS repeat-containing protein n=1 Tax=Streptomyces sp. NPDC023838 TaxID=3154325 RepID=UPI0033C2D069